MDRHLSDIVERIKNHRIIIQCPRCGRKTLVLTYHGCNRFCCGSNQYSTCRLFDRKCRNCDYPTPRNMSRENPIGDDPEPLPKKYEMRIVPFSGLNMDAPSKWPPTFVTYVDADGKLYTTKLRRF